MRSRSIVIGILTASALVAGAVALISKRASAMHLDLKSSADDVPLAEVERGEVDIDVHATGELRASHAVMLTAPSVGGGALQIVYILPTSSSVKKGDLVVQFDPGEQRYKLDQSRSELLQAEQEITKANADAAVLAAQDKVAELKARYDVRQAELDVQKKEIVSSIDARKNDLTLQQAQQMQTKTEQDTLSHLQSGQAAIYLAKEKYNKAKLTMDEAQQNIDKMRVTAPIDGMVSVQKNPPTDFFFTGMSVPDFHPGDVANPGSAIAQIVDPAGLELSCKLSERKSSSVSVGEPAQVVFDAMPGRTFAATVKTAGAMTQTDIFDNDSARGVDVTLQLAQPDPGLRAGMSAQILFLGEKKMNVLYLPRQAVFLKEGKRIVYIKSGGGYDQREIKLAGETESKAVVEGLNQGARVAMIDPTASRKPNASAGPSAAAPGVR